ncbi:TetR/AcrR family transcriptional regulator [Leptospira wolffii]|uniref:TetR family transcriptional regulator n=1 Tax=Leptospira wolffii TaxID=409998 RepID=A0A2M9ZBM8_9LEPT|nr:TetR/AcrR family transcriptional regulator [Leptospira wolffii]PJZ65809.1 TetR family transcriptional regulator [Leptospira wolffii]TGK59479.1 TetR/AcrR family transcriptional regulator [Leptospira wolffii]TGK71138.1 TetR/AcrR family transcriptional regulator [Leptospira wolffii]TGK77706.1 TetR/AcrR family transcriptional regulator [Leptospira wolffii]TGL29584.1 TetR/AcrR family transcriptional regulator [Leptospira wolffii]
MGLREQKKAKTRKLISDIARDLFIEKGFEAVTVAEIAEKAEVAVTTLFNYFPTKESLIFDLEDEIDSDISEAIRERKKDQSILDALHQYFLSSKLFNPPNKKTFSGFGKLIRTSPELSSYLRGLWGRYENTLAKEIQNDSGANKMEAECVSKLILEGVSFACNSPSPKDTLNLTFKILKNGWNK